MVDHGLVTSQEAMQALLTEFFDHGIVSKNGKRLAINLSPPQLVALLQQLESA